MDRMVKLRPEQAHRIKRLLYLSDGLESLQLSEVRFYKEWKDFFFHSICEMEELGLLTSIRTYPLGRAFDSDDRESGPEGSANQSVKTMEAMTMNNGEKPGQASGTIHICPVVHLATRQLPDEPTCEQLTQVWREFFLQVLWELQQDGLIAPLIKSHGFNIEKRINQRESCPR